MEKNGWLFKIMLLVFVCCLFSCQDEEVLLYHFHAISADQEKIIELLEKLDTSDIVRELEDVKLQLKAISEKQKESITIFEKNVATMFAGADAKQMEKVIQKVNQLNLRLKSVVDQAGAGVNFVAAKLEPPPAPKRRKIVSELPKNHKCYLSTVTCCADGSCDHNCIESVLMDNQDFWDKEIHMPKVACDICTFNCCAMKSCSGSQCIKDCLDSQSD
jgi:hypothetical protein